jgi:hypothetical protein
MIDSGSTRKYLLYAVGEIALVVIGILIALQINNWNEERIKKINLKKHVFSLSQAIEHDINELSISLEFNEFRYHSLQYLLEMAGTSYDSLPDMSRPEKFIEDEVWEGVYPDTINKTLIKLTLRNLNNAFLGFIFNRSAINEINNLGILSDIKDDSLKNLINEYYYHLDWRFGEQLINKKHEHAKELKNHLRDQHGISSNYPPDDLSIIEAIQEDKILVILIKDLIKVSNDHYWGALNIQNRAKKLLNAMN